MHPVERASGSSKIASPAIFRCEQLPLRWVYQAIIWHEHSGRQPDNRSCATREAAVSVKPRDPWPLARPTSYPSLSTLDTARTRRSPDNFLKTSLASPPRSAALPAALMSSSLWSQCEWTSRY